MRGIPVIVVLALTMCLVAVGAGTPQTTAVMTISGMPGQSIIQVDQTDWTQIPGMPDPRAPQATGSSNPLISRGSSPLGSPGGTSRGRSGNVDMQDLTIVKEVDRLSPDIVSKCSAGEHISEVTLEVRPAGGNEREYLVIEMTNVVIESIAPQSNTGRDRPTESVTLSYEKLNWEYRPVEGAMRATPPGYSFTPNRP